MANWIVYGKHLEGQYGATAERRIDFVADDMRCSLHTVTYVPNQDTDDFFNDATNELAAGGGYAAGGIALTGKSVTFDAASNEFRFDWDDLVWGPGATLAGIRVAVIWKNTAGAAATDPLFAYHLDTADRGVVNGTFTLDVDPTTTVKFTVSAA